MKTLHASAESTNHSKPTDGEGRKPFVAPALTREAGLTEATAERTFTFTTAS